MTITASTLITANGRRKTEITVQDGDEVVKRYRRRSLGPLGHLRFLTTGQIEYSFGKSVGSKAIVLRRR